MKKNADLLYKAQLILTAFFLQQQKAAIFAKRNDFPLLSAFYRNAAQLE